VTVLFYDDALQGFNEGRANRMPIEFVLKQTPLFSNRISDGLKNYYYHGSVWTSRRRLKNIMSSSGKIDGRGSNEGWRDSRSTAKAARPYFVLKAEPTAMMVKPALRRSG
jgi:hypothetical protein